MRSLDEGNPTKKFDTVELNEMTIPASESALLAHQPIMFDDLEPQEKIIRRKPRSERGQDTEVTFGDTAGCHQVFQDK